MMCSSSLLRWITKQPSAPTKRLVFAQSASGRLDGAMVGHGDFSLGGHTELIDIPVKSNMHESESWKHSPILEIP